MESSSSSARFSGKQKSIAASIAVVLLAAVYLLLHPFLERKLGVRLPNPLRNGGGGQNQIPGKDADNKDQKAGSQQTPRNTDKTPAGDKKKSGASTEDRSQTKARSQSQPSARSKSTAPAEFALRDVGKRVLVSPAGLRYGPGSREGHRTTHVLRHARDDPERPIHGVFDGSREKIFAVIDEAYLLAKKRGRAVKVEKSGSRTVFTVRLGRRVGFIGGQSGKRSKHPVATAIRLVLEDKNVITAFPVQP